MLKVQVGPDIRCWASDPLKNIFQACLDFVSHLTALFYFLTHFLPLSYSSLLFLSLSHTPPLDCFIQWPLCSLSSSHLMSLLPTLHSPPFFLFSGFFSLAFSPVAYNQGVVFLLRAQRLLFFFLLISIQIHTPSIHLTHTCTHLHTYIHAQYIIHKMSHCLSARAAIMMYIYPPKSMHMKASACAVFNETAGKCTAVMK